jgi:Copper transport outer membrane protein, MctB
VIDFRYHLVSIVAVFLALAIGIVVGATALTPKVAAGLEKLSSTEKQQIATARTKIANLKNLNSAEQVFDQAAAPVLLHDLLAGQKAVLVTAPGADGPTISGITSALEQAGAKVTGQVALQPAFFDTTTSTENSLDALAQKASSQSGVTLGDTTGQPDPIAGIAGQQEAAQVIAAALVTTDNPDTADLPASQVKDILSDFSQQGYLQVSPANGASTLAQATLAVVVIPATPPDPTAGDTAPANLALISLGQQLRTASRGVVLAGSIPGSGSPSAIDELIYGGTGIQLSSVDDANYEDGQILVAQALSYLLLGHKPAAYGYYPNAVPSPAPTPSPTPTPTPSSTPTHSSHG